MIDSPGIGAGASEPMEQQMEELPLRHSKLEEFISENDGNNINKMASSADHLDRNELSKEESSQFNQTVGEVPTQQQPSEPATAPLPPSPLMDHVIEDCGNTADTQQSLEERVQELESKLATLSLLLHQQRAQQNLNGSMGVSTSRISPTEFTPPDSPQNDTTRAAPALDSPAEHFTLSRQDRRRHNLSFRVLYQDADFPEPHEGGFGKRNRNDSDDVHDGISSTEQEGLLVLKSDELQVPDNFGSETTKQDIRRGFGRHDGNAPFPLSPSPILLRKTNDSMMPIEESPLLSRSVLDDSTGGEMGSFDANLSASNTPIEAKNKPQPLHMVPPELPLERRSSHLSHSGDDQPVAEAGKNDEQADSSGPEPESKSADTSTPSKTPNVPTSDGKLRSSTSSSKSGSATAPTKSKSVVNAENWLNYLNSFQESNHDVDKQMEEFVMVPSAVETLLSFGFWICVDSFLYSLTILPIRAIWSCLLLLRYIVLRLTIYYGSNNEVPDGPYRFHRRHSYQLIQIGIIYTVYKIALVPVSIGKLYHWIRGQSMIKLYVLIAIVEVFDRLLCSLGQDCLDSLYWNTTRRPRSSRMVVAAFVVLLYTIAHSFLLFIHVATLNVAMNSADQALLTLLISGNFAEIKSTVFKKYNKPNLFKITASDICERFKLALFLGLVLILNMSQGMDRKMVMSYCQMCGIVWCAEWLADWIKHSFITKFNYISSSIYPHFALLLAGDVTGIGHEGVNLDHSHAVVKRLGFAQIPLVCVMFRYVREAVKYASEWEIFSQVPSWLKMFAAILLWILLLAVKVSLGNLLHSISEKKLAAAPELSKSMSSLPSVSTEKKKN